MSPPTSKVAGTALVPKGGEDISRLVETHRCKNFFYHRKNSLMRYNNILEDKNQKGCVLFHEPIF